MIRPVPYVVARLNFAAASFIDERVLETSLKTAKKDKKNAPVGMKHKKPVTSAPKAMDGDR
jgi:hypothetical protein